MGRDCAGGVTAAAVTGAAGAGDPAGGAGLRVDSFVPAQPAPRQPASPRATTTREQFLFNDRYSFCLRMAMED